MSEKRKATNLGVYIDPDIRERLDKCAKREKRTMKAIVELALSDYLDKSEAEAMKGGR